MDSFGEKEVLTSNAKTPVLFAWQFLIELLL